MKPHDRPPIDCTPRLRRLEIVPPASPSVPPLAPLPARLPWRMRLWCLWLSVWLQVDYRWRHRRLWRWKAHGRTGCDYTLFHRAHVLNTRWGNLVLHWIINADPLPLGLHNHPWDFKSWVLWGGYTEMYLPDWIDPKSPDAELAVYYRYRGPGSFGSHPSAYTHAIIALRYNRPCLTLCWTSKRNRQWGFPSKDIVVG